MMAKSLSFTAKATFPLAACVLAASLGGVARAGDKAQMTGHWNFNLDQSDDAKQKVEDAQVDSQHTVTDASGGSSNPGGGGTYPGGGGGYPIGGMGGRGGMGGMGGMGGPGGGMGRGSRQATRGPAVTSDQWDRLADNPKYLRIDQRSDQFVVINDADQAQTFYPDGKKHDDKDADGKKITTRADWEGDSFVAETKISRAQKLTQTFRLSDDGKQLYVTTRFEDTSMSAPLSIRRVYDLAKSPPK
jgi:hypothetical protein